MLKTLVIENIAVIKKAQIEFTSGLNVLTGETGAGKSIVVDSINAILGERTSRELVRAGSDNAFVNAYFEDINDDVKLKLNEYDIPIEEDGSLLLSRKISAGGKSVCRVNGLPVTVGILKDIGTHLVNIHGQHDSQALLNPDFHYKFVDAYADCDELLAEYKESFKSFLNIRRQLKSLTSDADERDKQSEILDYQIKELRDADIKVGEWEELKHRKSVILNSQAILNALNTLLGAVNGDDENQGIQSVLSSSDKEITALLDADSQLKPIIEKLDSAEDLLESIKDLISDKMESLDFQPDELDKIEERLDILYTFSNKYGETEQDMLYYLADAERKRALFDNSEQDLERLNAEYDSSLEKTQSLALKLSEVRRKAAEKLGEEICSQLEFLDMPGVKFVTQFSKGNLSSVGVDKIEFLIRTNPGEEPKPLAKIASGGELSRIMLAIKSIIAKSDSIATLIFDEIDTGVSGKASRKIGLKLKEVGKNAQVICVTHSAQIASAADSHFLIKKEYTDNAAFTQIMPLDFEGRKYELARIMGGLNVTESLLKSAEEMLDYGN
ncbi:DNA repair protein RecN [Eubacterium sp.]|uniref:DNA repair protein RecN n=1 Tax=Eubacterium sp. TaxID=142586 RepID=UPI0025C46283|nr:DNA repair protein RecN [Eubacterium sp.]MCI7801407.1 DNA repair protein RecN [Eubacterium sp.]